MSPWVVPLIVFLMIFCYAMVLALGIIVVLRHLFMDDDDE